jgi:hypothetical protein
MPQPSLGVAPIAHAGCVCVAVWSSLKQQQGQVSPARKAAIFYLLEQMADYCSELRSSAGALVPTLADALTDASPPPVRLAAAKALMALVVATDSQGALKLKPLCPGLLAALALPLHAQVGAGDLVTRGSAGVPAV